MVFVPIAGGHVATPQKALAHHRLLPAKALCAKLLPSLDTQPPFCFPFTQKHHAKPLRILRRLLSVRSASIYSAHPALHSLAFAVPLPRSSTSFRQGERSTLLDDFHSAIAPWLSALAIAYALTRTGCADGEKNEQSKTVIH
jgi:hypothetical protein